jgi:hypothetical protein
MDGSIRLYNRYGDKLNTSKEVGVIFKFFKMKKIEGIKELNSIEQNKINGGSRISPVSETSMLDNTGCWICVCAARTDLEVSEEFTDFYKDYLVKTEEVFNQKVAFEA